jgi:hypothetical protein
MIDVWRYTAVEQGFRLDQFVGRSRKESRDAENIHELNRFISRFSNNG